MKLIVTALNPKNGETDEIEVEKDRSEKIIRKMNDCKWFVDDSDQISDSLHAIGINQYDLDCWVTDSQSIQLEKCRGFHVFVDRDFPNTKSPSKMHIEHGNSYFTQSKQIIKFDSIEEQCKFWDHMMSNLMSPNEVELLRKAELEPNENEAAIEMDNGGEKDMSQGNSPLEKPTTLSSGNLNLEIGRLVDLYEIDVVTKMINSLDKFRNANAIISLEERAISLWSEYIDKVGKNPSKKV